MTAGPSAKMMKIYSPFEGRWRDIAKGMSSRKT